MAIMNGQHALRPHNRKFYFNSFINKFEPIYYDGDLDFNKKIIDSLRKSRRDYRLISRNELGPQSRYQRLCQPS